MTSSLSLRGEVYGSVEFVPAGPNEPNTFPVTCVWGIL